MASQDIHVYLDSNAITPVVHAVQNDTGRRLVIHITDEVINSATVGRLYFVRSDGSHYNVEANVSTIGSGYCTVSAGIDHFTQVLTQPGKTHCQIQITDSSGLVSSHTFIVDVQRSANALTIRQSGYTIDDLARMASEIAETAADVDAVYAEAVAWINSLNLYTYGGYVPNNTDLNTLTGYKFYLLSADRKYKHWSVGGGGIVIHQTLSNGNARQIAFKESGLWYRRQVSGTWHDWVDVIGNSQLAYNAFTFDGTLPDQSDLNDIDGNCFLHVNIDYEYSNLPVAFPIGGVLINETISENAARQIFIKEGYIYYRRKVGGSWRPWNDVIASNDTVQKALHNASGQPVPVEFIADMTDTEKTYLYIGHEDGQIYGHWWYYGPDPYAPAGMGTYQWVDSGQYGMGVGGNYPDLINKPKINMVVIEGNKTSADYGLVDSSSFTRFEERVLTEIESIHAYYQATGDGEEIELESGTITQIPLGDTDAMFYGDAFEISDGGIKVKDAGIYKIAGSVYLHTDAASTREGCYIKAGPSLAEAEELVSIYLPTGDTNTYGGIGTPVKVVELDADDIVYLCARQTGGTASSVYTNNVATFLYVEKMGAGFTETEAAIAELNDIRTAYDGTVYASAGEAVRMQGGVALVVANAAANSVDYLEGEHNLLLNEIQDARTGADGTEYATLGYAIRDQIEQAMESGSSISVTDDSNGTVTLHIG